MRITFAYGANLDADGMRQRCPQARSIGPGRLDNWRFQITRDGYASIVPRIGHSVHGILWHLSARDEVNLDTFEGIDQGLYRKTHIPVRGPHGPVRALVYVARSQATGRPHKGYLDQVVLPAARAWGLPAAHVSELESWLRPG